MDEPVKAREDLTERQRFIIDFGWMLCKEHRSAKVFLWLADEDWIKAWEITATQGENGVRVGAEHWLRAALIPEYHPN